MNRQWDHILEQSSIKDANLLQSGTTSWNEDSKSSAPRTFEISGAYTTDEILLPNNHSKFDFFDTRPMIKRTSDNDLLALAAYTEEEEPPQQKAKKKSRLSQLKNIFKKKKKLEKSKFSIVANASDISTTRNTDKIPVNQSIFTGGDTSVVVGGDHHKVDMKFDIEDVSSEEMDKRVKHP